MPNEILLSGTLVLLVMLSAYFSATETAFSSINKFRLKILASNGNNRAQLVLTLSHEYDKLLSTILIGNNIVNILSASLATILFTLYYPNSGVTISTVVMTVVILIFGEISPKSLAKESPETWAMISAPLLKIFLIMLAPLNYFFSGWKYLLSKLFSFSKAEAINPDEILLLIDEAKHTGSIAEPEGNLIRSAIEFNRLCAKDILTPRVQLIAVELSTSAESIKKIFSESGYSRLPVFKNNIDHIVGILHEKDFHLNKNKSHDLSSLLKPVIYKKANIKISKLLQTFQQTQTQLAVISDEYGGTLGIVTLEDILESLVGDIWDEYDEITYDVEPLNETDYLVLGQANLAKFSSFFKINLDVDCNSVNGWIVQELGFIPPIGTIFEYENLSLEILNSDDRQIIQLKVTSNEKEHFF